MQDVLKVYSSVEDVIEPQIKELLKKLSSKRFADRAMKAKWAEELYEISLLRKGIGELKEKFYDRVLPY